MNDVGPPDRSGAAASAAGQPVVPPPLRQSRWASARQRIQRLKGPIVAFAAVGTVLGGLAGWWNSYRTVRSGAAPTAVTTAPAAAVKPHSAADRRMTFAVLSFTGPSGDAEAARLALAAFESAQTQQEARTNWARVAPRALVQQAMATPSSLRQLGQMLDVHFLLRGNITLRATGYSLDLTVLDVQTEAPLASRSIPFEAGRPSRSRRPARSTLRSAR